MDEDILIPAMFFFTVIVLSIGVPLVRAYVRRSDRSALMPQSDPAISDRLERMEHAIDAVAVEVERIAESQRFVTRLLSDQSPDPVPIPARSSQGRH
jgi:hypothetical protein